MVNESYDVNEAFRSIEQELISSMMRNLESHKAEETKEGYNWSAWQAEQLKALRQYRQRNKDKYTKEFSLINAQIDGLIKDARKDGQLEQEKKILQAIKSGRLEDKMDSTFEGKFFKTNDRKINSLIKATKKDFRRGETAMLRQADDQYRKIIFNAQMYAASGAGTYEKAVDMATKDFLTRGITSIEYKNGSRHTMEDYSRMCLRTACKRAYFTGEGEMRNSRGQHLVIMIKRGNPCPKCAPWVGKVLIDDVWSGGSREDGDYPLMSEAIAAGLYHPNCLDSHTTYFDDGFDEEYDREHDSDTNVGNMKEEYTKEERQQLAEEYNIEQKAGYAMRQQERFERLEEFSLDPENKRVYRARSDIWKEKVNEFENSNKNNKQLDERFRINKKYINSNDYKRLFNNLKEQSKITREIWETSKRILVHRDGTEYEDLAFINEKTGKCLINQSYNVKRQCITNRLMKRMISESPANTIICIHNHPGSSCPSIQDLVIASKRKYKYGLILCHNGYIFKYAVKKEISNIRDVNNILDMLNARIYNEKKDIQGINDLIEMLKEYGIELEMFI